MRDGDVGGRSRALSLPGSAFNADIFACNVIRIREELREQGLFEPFVGFIKC